MHYACIFFEHFSEAEALSIIVHFRGIFPENHYFFRKKIENEEGKKLFTVYTFLLALKSTKKPLYKDEHY